MLISLGCTELFSGSVTDLWLYVSPHQQIDIVLNKTEVGDYTVDCVGIKTNASPGFYDIQTINKAKYKISDTVRFCRRQ